MSEPEYWWDKKIAAERQRQMRERFELRFSLLAWGVFFLVAALAYWVGR